MASVTLCVLHLNRQGYPKWGDFMKKTVLWLGLSIVAFFGLLLLTVLYGGSGGLGICLILFLCVYPLFFITEGIVCGLTLQQHWWLPLASAVIYLLSAWILLDMGETAFLIYTGMYLGVSVMAMLGAYFAKKLQTKHPA